MIKHILFFSLIAFTTTISAQSNLEVEINNLKNTKGKVLVELIDQNNKHFAWQKKDITEIKCFISFSNIPDGKYAIRYYHDENLNEKLDQNIIGIPKEGFGFSNDAMGLFGPKDFEEWLFPIYGDTIIKLKTFYLL